MIKATIVDQSGNIVHSEESDDFPFDGFQHQEDGFYKVIGDPRYIPEDIPFQAPKPPPVPLPVVASVRPLSLQEAFGEQEVDEDGFIPFQTRHKPVKEVGMQPWNPNGIQQAAEKTKHDYGYQKVTTLRKPVGIDKICFECHNGTFVRTGKGTTIIGFDLLDGFGISELEVRQTFAKAELCMITKEGRFWYYDKDKKEPDLIVQNMV